MVVIAMGPWAVLAAEWLRLPLVYGLKGHSLVFETGVALPPEALFLQYTEPAGSMLSPKIFSRADDTTYVCAISSESPVRIDPERVAPEVLPRFACSLAFYLGSGSGRDDGFTSMVLCLCPLPCCPLFRARCRFGACCRRLIT